jgi:hypothetical protein
MVIAWLVVLQVVELRHIGNGLSLTADPYSEANAFRAAEHYATKGFLVDTGLPHIVYGTQFPHEGWVIDLWRWPLPQGVYTRYPPLPDLVCGVFERFIGREYRVLWRVLPIALGLLALVFVYTRFRNPIGTLPAAGVVALLGVTPLTTTYLHGLHFQGYAHALAIVQMAVTASILLGARHPTVGEKAALGGLGLLQGWLSFEYLLLVSFMALPLYFVARAAGGRQDRQSVVWLVGLPAAGFLAAHALHLLQVAVFYGSLNDALQDYGGRMRFRLTDIYGAPHPYFWVLSTTGAAYLILLFTGDPAGEAHFGVLLPILVLAAAGIYLVLSVYRLRMESVADEPSRGPPRNGGGRVRPAHALAAIGSAFVIAGGWLVIMPAHAISHVHVVPRVFILPYMTCALLLGVFPLRALGRRMSEGLYG